MAIAFQNVYGAVGLGADPHTVSSVVVNAGDIIVVFTCQPGGSATITSVKWNTTESLTAIQTLTASDGGVGAGNSAWIIENPTATTADIVVDWSTTGGSYAACHVLVYSGVKNDAGPSGAWRALTVPDGSAGTGADASVAATSGDWIVCGCSNWDNGNNATLSAGTNLTARRIDNSIQTDAYDFATGDTAGTVSGTTTVGWTNDEFCTNIAFALIPGAGGGGGTVRTQSTMTMLGVQ